MLKAFLVETHQRKKHQFNDRSNRLFNETRPTRSARSFCRARKTYAWFRYNYNSQRPLGSTISVVAYLSPITAMQFFAECQAKELSEYFGYACKISKG